MKYIKYEPDYFEYIKFVFYNALDLVEIVDKEIWKQTTRQEQESMLFGYWFNNKKNQSTNRKMK